MTGKAGGPVTQTSPFRTVVIDDGGGRRTASSGRGDTGTGRQKWRLLVVSSRARHVGPIAQSLLPGVLVVTFKYETSTLDDILNQVAKVLDGRKVESIALVFHGTENMLFLCGPGDKVLNTHTAAEQVSVREFLKSLVTLYVDRSLMNARLDFLAGHPAHSQDGPIISAILQALLEMPVSMSVDLHGSDVEVVRWEPEGSCKVSLGQLYFDLRSLKENMKNMGLSTKLKKKDIKKHYEKVRTVGKGAFGSAVLYRRKEDDAMVIIKEINMLELSAPERQMALNEINVLAMLDHPNIVSYMDSFERDTMLCIEMEYADGGNLGQYLTQQVKKMDERDVLVFFHQIAAALKYMHEHHVLHRDLKTANIFLTKQGVVKVGDFGISKMLSTQQGHANTVLGTPYYISPEMCEGKQYDEKSDIWALGCILYEMACLQKTFEGSNLPALVNKIMKGQFAPIKGNYSPGFRQLVRDLLQRDPEFRPTSAEIVTERLPELLAQFSLDPLGVEEIDEEIKMSIEAAKQNQTSKSSRPPRSVVYHLKAYESSIRLTPVPLPPRVRVKEMAVSNTHMVVLTSECLVYTWGENKKGQLGHGTLEAWRSRPMAVEALKGKAITKVCAGDGFSVFSSDNGIVMTCGDGSFGCLGHGDWNSTSKPKLLERLLSVDVSAISCGTHHVVIVEGEGEVYSWGRGEGGRLGLGNEEDYCIPTEVEVPEDVLITNVRCGGDATIFITDQGAMLACGRNTRNKLGLSDAGGIFSVRVKEVDKAIVPSRMKSVGCRVVDVAMGPTHTAVLAETGQVITFGRNSEGQLGRGNCRSSIQPVLVKSMSKKVITMVTCGSTFSVVGTLENAIYLWGTRAVSPITRPNTQEGFTNTWSQRSAPGTAEPDKDPDFNFKESINGVLPPMDSGPGGPMEMTRKTSNGSVDGFNHQRNIGMRDVLHTPQEILALYASPAQIAKGETVSLGSLHCQNQSIFMVIDTTVPLPRPERLRELNPNIDPNMIPKPEAQIPREEENGEIRLDMHDSGDSSDESMDQVPDWLKADLNEAEQFWSGENKGKIEADAKNKKNKANRASKRASKPMPPKHQKPPSPKERARRAPFSKAPKSREVKSPFVPGSPRQVSVVAERQKVRRITQEMQFKEDNIRKEAANQAKEKEAALENEIEYLRRELTKQEEAKKMNLELKENQAPESTGCFIM